MNSAIELRPADEGAAAAAWRELWEGRQRTALAAQGLNAGDVSERIEQTWRELEKAADFLLSQVVSAGDGSPLGYAVAGLFGPESGRYGIVVDLWIEPAWRRLGHGRAALAEVLAWLRSAGADRALVTLDPGDPAQSALFRDGEVNSQRMELGLSSPAEIGALPDGLSSRPLTDAEYPAWLALHISGYAEQNIASGTLSEAAAQTQAEKVYANLLPEGLATPETSITVLEDAGKPVATLWLRHHLRSGLSYVFSVEVDEASRGKGYGRTIMRLGERVSLEAGDSVLGLNVFGHNTVAIGLYTSLGYTVTDQSRTFLL